MGYALTVFIKLPPLLFSALGLCELTHTSILCQSDKPRNSFLSHKREESASPEELEEISEQSDCKRTCSSGDRTQYCLLADNTRWEEFSREIGGNFLWRKNLFIRQTTVPNFIFSTGCKSRNFLAQNGRYQFPTLLCFNRRPGSEPRLLRAGAQDIPKEQERAIPTK
jgi:hypothetical protein